MSQKFVVSLILVLVLVAVGVFLAITKEGEKVKVKELDVSSIEATPTPENLPAEEIVPALTRTQTPASPTSNRGEPTPTSSFMPTQTPSGLIIEDLKIGEGQEVKSGDLIRIHYLGTLTNGTKFDSSYDRGQPFETQIGVGRVIAGWDEGVLGMKVGGKRKLTIPPQLAYGERGAGAVIPPNATLIFEVELVEIK